MGNIYPRKMGHNPNVLGCILWSVSVTMKASKTRRWTPVDREKMIRFVNKCMEKATNTQLRLLSMVAYHVTRK